MPDFPPRQQRLPGAVLCLCLLLPLASSPVRAQMGQPKPPVAPSDGKPARFGPPPPKIAIATLTFRLRHDRRLDGTHIHVTASGHRVGLYGSVPNLHQRRIARQIAQSMMGITIVDDHLQVLNQPPPAEGITRQVQSALAQDPITRGAPLAVTAHQDIVTLRGTVATLRVKLAAIRHAHAVPGVTVVQDHILVPAGATGDTLVASVQAALVRDTANPISKPRVLAKGGYIYLRGAVPSQGDKQRAGDTAAGVPGVTGLTNALTVLPSFLQKTLPAGR